MSRFFSHRFDSLEPYVPGEQPKDSRYVKLNTNESPFPPSPKVIEAVNEASVGRLRLYSDPDCTDCVKAVAESAGVLPSNVILGNGSDEILSFVFRAYCDDDTPVAYPDISYGFYEVFADVFGLERRVVPLREDFSISPEDYFGIGCTVVIANPNAPTGLALGLDDIRAIVASNPDNIVCVDEAYVDFGASSAVGLIKEFDNLIVVQTFSKSRQLAGARLGMGFADEKLIKDMNALRCSLNPYNVNSLTLLAGAAAVKDAGYFEATRNTIISNRESATAELKRRGFTVLDSKANFLFASHPEHSGEELYLRLKSLGVLVRHFSKPRISDHLRITIGSAEQMRALFDALDEILK